MSLMNAFKVEKMPMKTIQKKQNRRKNKASKFVKIARAFKRGRVPKDIRGRAYEPIPPMREDKESEPGRGA